MAVKSHITDGTGSKSKAKVNGDNALYVTQIPYPPLVPQLNKPFRQYLTDDGTSSGSNDLTVDGSSTNVDFWVKASATDDRYISQLNFIVGYGTSGQPNEWADGTALTNGFRLFYEAPEGEIDIHEAIKTNQDMFRLSLAPVPTSWEVRHVNATNDYGYFIHMDINKMGFPFGIKLDKGTTQKLVIKIKDNMGTDTDSMNCIAYGSDRFER
jgi:hypothetical protein